MTRLLLTFCFVLVAVTLCFKVSGNPTDRPKFTLDPQTLAEVKKQLLKDTTTEIPTKKFKINLRLGNREHQPIIFDEGSSRGELKSRNSGITQTTSPAAGDHKCLNTRERFHLGSGKCYTLGTVGGPCGDNMLFYAQEGNKIYGDCDCNYNAEIPLLFHPGTSACYPVYTQAYCKADEWLVFDPQTEKPKCEPRKCIEDPIKTLVYFNSRCVEWDQWDSDCAHAHHRVIFSEEAFTPICAEPPTSEQSNFNIPKLKCKSGSSQDIKGNCREKIKFNFNG